MVSPRRNIISRSGGIIVVGALLTVLFWLADSMIDAHFENTRLLQQLFSPGLHGSAKRLLALVVLLVFMVYIMALLKKRTGLEGALEEALAKAEEEKEKSNAILEALGDAISIQDTDLRILYQNQANRDTMGRHVGEFCYQAYHHKEKVCDNCQLVMSFSDGKGHLWEASAMTEKGLKNVEIMSTPLRDAHGKIIAGIEAVRDVTDRKLVEGKLRKQLEAMESSIDGIAILNQDGEYIYLNKAHAEVYGYENPQELMGKTWHVLYHEDELRRFEREVLPILWDKKKWRGEAVGKRRDGSTFAQEVSLTVMEDGGLVCVVRDITERKRSEEEKRKLNEELQQRALDLAASNRELEAFSYSVSHDLRTPLTRIYSSGQLLQEEYAPRLDESGKYLVKTICDASEHMEELIDDLLDLSRVTSIEMRSDEVDLSELARMISVELRLEQPDRQVTFIISPGLMVQGDEQLLKVALENLLGNAWKYTRNRDVSRIEFGMSESEGEKIYFVRDNGVGFAMNDAGKLFKPFQRLHSAQEFPGTGIGLATVQRIIQRHGGKVWAEGEVDKGATFSFTLK